MATIAANTTVLYLSVMKKGYVSSKMTVGAALILLIAGPAFGEDHAKNWGIVPVPVLGFSPDFGAIIGLAGIAFYGPDVGVPEGERVGLRNNTVAVNGFGTTNGSFVAVGATTNYFRQEFFRLDTRFASSRRPSTYYGVGSDSSKDDGIEHTPTAFELTVGPSVQVARDLFIGPEIDAAYTAVKEVKATEPTVIEDVARIGVGAQLIWDTTGGVFFPLRGVNIETRARQYLRALGGDHTYGIYTLDARAYRGVWLGHVLAVQGLYQRSWGDPDWNMLPGIGGDGVFRGLLEGRFRDEATLSAQLEYRAPVTSWLGFVLFGSVGQVGANVVDMEWSEPKLAAGAGVRIALNRAQRLNFRIDVSFVGEEISPYINAREAF